MDIESIAIRAERYYKLMGMVINGSLHLKKNGERIQKPLSELQKKKDYFLYRYYKFHYDKLMLQLNPNYIQDYDT